MRLIDLLPKSNNEICYFNDLKNKLIELKIEIVNKDSQFFLVKFEEKKTEYLVRFANTGELIAIEYEYWKDDDVKFNFKDLTVEEGIKNRKNKYWNTFKFINK